MKKLEFVHSIGTAPKKGSDQGSAAMLSIPEDIKIEILTRLPVKSLLRCRCVSKSWFKLIKSPNFVNHQLNHSLKYGDHGILYNDNRKIFCVDYDSSASALSNTVVQFDYPLEQEMRRILRLSGGGLACSRSEYRMLGSCNGLICYMSSYRNIIIWNPYTRDYKKIPTPIESTGYHVFDSYEFCYDLNTEDYKVARMANIPENYSEIAVYSLKLDLWKTFSNIHPVFPSKKIHLVFFEGVLHWVEMVAYEHPRMICCFDIGNGAFKEISIPQHLSNKLYRVSVCLLGGCLCLTGSLYKKCSEVWVMKDYGVHGSWSKMFTIGEGSGLGAFGYLYPKQSFKIGVILVQVDSSGSYLYDLKHKKFTKLEINGRMRISTLPFFGELSFT